MFSQKQSKQGTSFLAHHIKEPAQKHVKIGKLYCKEQSGRTLFQLFAEMQNIFKRAGCPLKETQKYS